MFAVVELIDTITLKATEVNDCNSSYIKELLIQKFEKKVHTDIYIVKIIDVDINSIKNGYVNELDGSISYKVIYHAAVFDPQFNETFEVFITRINDVEVIGYPRLSNTKLLEGTDSVIECKFSKDMDKTKLDKLKLESTVNAKIIYKHIEYNKMTLLCSLN